MAKTCSFEELTDRLLAAQNKLTTARAARKDAASEVDAMEDFMRTECGVTDKDIEAGKWKTKVEARKVELSKRQTELLDEVREAVERAEDLLEEVGNSE